MVLWQLFLSFFKTGLFALGGAYSFLPLIESEVVEKYSWLTRDEFFDVLGMVKLFPGAISIKYATYTGYKVAGVFGVIVANIGNFLAPVVLIMFATKLYTHYRDLPSVKGAFDMIQMALTAMILGLVFKMVSLSEVLQLKNLAVIIVAFVIFSFSKIHPAFVIVGAGIIGAVLK